MFDPTNYTSDGTILEVTFGKGPNTNKYMKYIKKGMLHNTYKFEVLDNRIYEPNKIGGYPESILACKPLDSNASQYTDTDIKFIEVIYPRDLIKVVNK
tara:strand:+ start:273 stop:566 length:294 start_codon:yes stop_codon:yes gene_type:complete